MTYIIGLGGTGSKFVKACVDGGHHFTKALTIDNTTAEHAPTVPAPVEHLQLIDSDDLLHDVIARGISLSLNSENSQDRLRDLASWRPDASNLGIAIQAGSGQIRAIGRSISIAKRGELRTAIKQFLSSTEYKSQIVIAASTDGGTGSSLLWDVIDLCNSGVFGLFGDRKQIAVLLFDSLVMDFGTQNLAANSFQTLSEMTHVPWNLYSENQNTLTFHIVQTSSATQIQDAFKVSVVADKFPFPMGNERVYLDDGQILHQYSQDSEVLEAALQRSASRLFYATSSLDELHNSPVWPWGRTQPLLNSIALNQETIQALTAGWLSLGSRGLIQVNEGSVLFQEGETTHRIRLLRQTTEQPVDALPVVLETISLCIRLEREDPATFGAISYLIKSSENFKPIPEAWNATLPERQSSSRQLGEDLAAYYGKLAVSSLSTTYSSPATSDDQISYIQEQLILAEKFSLEPYDGSECVLRSGQVTPDSTLFRDISHIYIDVCKKYMDTATEIATSRNRNKIVFEGKASPQQTKSRRMSRRIYAKPGMTIRFGVPAGLIAISVVGIITFLSSAYYRTIWADTSTAVGGIMGIVAVCLGAVALMWSIQNSSVETARTDRLFTACLGIQEMTLMLRIALQNAIATNESRESGSDLWQHQSLRLAAFMLGKRITEALDSGLFGLLASIDEDNGVGRDLPMSSASRKVFVLLDDLVRVAPEIISDKELEIREKPADPERVLQLAEELRGTLEPVTYRYMADTLRRTPASV
jgi:hypothetical protein